MLPNADRTKSYWIEAAESDLRDFRSTESLPLQTDIVIVGGGYSGATAAYWLHKYTSQHGTTPSMLLLEARDTCGSATGRNGGQLRPHAYSRYNIWKARFGPETAMHLIRHEMAHLPAFQQLLDEEGIMNEACCKFGETFDAAMTDEAWERLTSNLLAMRKDHGTEDEIVKAIKLIEVAEAAEAYTQMKGAVGAIIHPAGQIWPYKFVHALLRIILATGQLNLQAHTPAEQISDRDAEGWISVSTARGTVKTRAVVHATNRWAAHLLPELATLVYPGLSTVSAIKAPEGFIKHTGAQHWDANINNYWNQLPAPYNTIILGGAKSVVAHQPSIKFTDKDDALIPGVPAYMRSWASTHITNWPLNESGDLALPAEEGGNWTGVEATTSDAFPFVGPVPGREGHFIAAGFNGHGMPRILLSTAHIAPLILSYLNIESSAPGLVRNFPALPTPFLITRERIEKLQGLDFAAKMKDGVESALESARKPFCASGKVFYEEAIAAKREIEKVKNEKVFVGTVKRSDTPVDLIYKGRSCALSPALEQDVRVQARG
ncbi:hypothetical protein FKW77_002137 [Venturia effusa]|uniref:FAD dependent oxidoreductase domain-containing protein n=1 Tax=Venturia effusa TaxID=50376 RepID=A0A517LC07_9PEZI|nr:hypothetical protein FKW77_002137 [Venturia effusa]